MKEVWFAIRLFTLRQLEVAKFFEERNFEVFIPMQYTEVEDAKHKVQHVLRPVVRNLIFVKKSMEDEAFKQLISNSTYKMSVITRSRSSREYAEIPDSQMKEFQIMCNPDLAMTKYITTQEAHLKAGTPVFVTHGPLKGLSGRLVRQHKLYYILKEIPGMAVMLKVSRWCCKAQDSASLNDKG